MSEVAGLSGAAECSTTATVTQQRDAAELTDRDDLATASTGDQGCGPSAEGVVDGAGATADDSATTEGAPSSDVHEGSKDSDSDERTSVQVSDCSVVDAAVTVASAVADARAEPSDAASAGDVATCDHVDTVGRSSSSSTAVQRSPPPLPSSTLAARHALPSAVAAPCVRGKHRLPPVLTTSGSGQGHGMERISPLSLVVGAHPATDPARAASSLTGGTRLGDLGLSASGSSGSQPGLPASGTGSQPPLNLSVSDEAVNMKVVSATTERSATDAGTASRAGTYRTVLLRKFVLDFR